jgi:hypothetical protein
MSQVDIEAKREAGAPEEWKPQKKELFIMISLSFISLMVALDATVLVTVLPVSNMSTGVMEDTDMAYRSSHIS